MSIKYIIQKAIESKTIKQWDKLYWCIDVHNTIVPSRKDSTYEEKDVYPYALDVLHVLSQRDDMCIILFTATTEDNLTHLFRIFKENNIIIDYLNENPECKSNGKADFSSKFYYDILLDDKAGFCTEEWRDIFRCLNFAHKDREQFESASERD